MKYILLKGKMDAGKSSTITAICQNFNISSCQRISLDANGKLKIQNDTSNNYGNGTFIINVNGSNILIVAGAPTEQKITITLILIFIMELQIEISIGLISVRSREVLAGFDTVNELEQQGHVCILEEEINRIDRDDFALTSVWQNRIRKISDLINDNLFQTIQMA
jgi:hypothetical protein